MWRHDYDRNIKLKLRHLREAVFAYSILYHLAKIHLVFGNIEGTRGFKAKLYDGRLGTYVLAEPDWWGEQLDLTRPAVAAGFAVALAQARYSAQLAATHGGRFMVVMMLFKEQVIVPLLIARGELTPG